MTIQDEFLIALTSWRENRQAGQSGLQSIVNVIVNRSTKTGNSPYTVCISHEQFSSISVPGPEDVLWAVETDPQWQMALSLAEQAAAGTLADITGGATLYYAPASIQSNETITINGTVYPFPQGWNESVVTFTCEIGGQLFFTQN